MRDIATKVDNGGATPDGQLSAEEYNDVQEDIENSVSRSGQALIATDTTQMSRSMTLHGTCAGTMAVGGTADALVLTPLTGDTGFRMPSSYAQMDGMMVNLVPIANNTGNVTVDIGQTAGTLLGTKNLLDDAGGQLGAGALVAGTRVFAVYDVTADAAVGAWVLFGGGQDATGVAGGDLSGSYPNPNVDRIRGNEVETGTPGDGDILVWNDAQAQWEHQPKIVNFNTALGTGTISNGSPVDTVVDIITLNLGTVIAGEFGFVSVRCVISTNSFGPAGNFARISLQKDSGTAIISIMGSEGSSIPDSLQVSSPPSPITNGQLFAFSAPFTVTVGGTYVIKLVGGSYAAVTGGDLPFSGGRIDVQFTKRLYA